MMESLSKEKHLTEADLQLVQECRRIATKGLSAEVKRQKDGKWVVYEVSKKRKEVG